MTTNTKAIIDKNKRHILAQYKGRGGAKQFVKEVEGYMSYDRYSSPYKAMEYIVNEPGLLYTNYDIERYLISLGLDPVRFKKFGMWDLYRSLMQRDGAKLYEELKKKGVEKTKKAIAVKKKSGPFGL